MNRDYIKFSLYKNRIRKKKLTILKQFAICIYTHNLVSDILKLFIVKYCINFVCMNLICHTLYHIICIEAFPTSKYVNFLHSLQPFYIQPLKHYSIYNFPFHLYIHSNINLKTTYIKI